MTLKMPKMSICARKTVANKIHVSRNKTKQGI